MSIESLGICARQISPDGAIPSTALNCDPTHADFRFGTLVPLTLSTGIDPNPGDIGYGATTDYRPGQFYYHAVDNVFRYWTGSAWANWTAAGGTTSMDSAYNSGSAITVDTAAISMTNAHATIDTMTIANSHATGAGDGLQITLSGATTAGHGLNVDITGATSAANGLDVNITQAGATGHCINLASTSGTGMLVNSTNFTVDPAGAVVCVGITDTGGITSDTSVTTTGSGTMTSAGLLTVSAGGAAITGNSTITGDLAVTGALSWGGALDAGGTVTVDELIWDTDGVAPAGTNCYGVSDNTGDLTLNCLTGKTINLAVNGTDEYAFSASAVNLNSNHLDNAGYLVLNAVTVPAATEVYVAHDNTGDCTINALTGKKVHLAEAATDLLDVGNGEVVINEGAGDVNFRVETDNCAYMIYADGANDSIAFGSNADETSADYKFIVAPKTWTLGAAATGVVAGFWSNGITTAGDAGTHALITTAHFSEPVITNAGETITEACTVYIQDAPTEGAASANYGLLCKANISVKADATKISIGAGDDAAWEWSTGDADNHALALGLGASLALHVCQLADTGTDWAVAADSDPSLYIHGATTPATEYIKVYTDETDAHLNAAGANWSFEIGGTAELTLAANALNLVDSVLYGSASAHSADTADGSLYLESTSNGTKGFVCLPSGAPGLVVGSDGSVDRATTVGKHTLNLFNSDGTVPSGTLGTAGPPWTNADNGITLYAEGGECKVLDAAGNSTTLSPHTDDGDYVIHSYAAAGGRDETLTIHLEKLIRALVAEYPSLARFITTEKGHAKRAKNI